LRGHAQQPAAPAATVQPSAQSPVPDQADKKQTAVDSASAQQQEIAKESADLLKMATALKIAVDKTSQDTLSIAVVKKASEIEQLARKARNGSGKS
jgi:type VI protein secretion system component VasF